MTETITRLPAGPLAVLLLEDDPLDAELLVERLRGARLDCDVHWVKDGASFEAALRERVFDIVLSDFSLPDFSGTEALACTQRLASGTPFIFVSGVMGEEHAVDMLKLGATDYVMKTRMARLPLAIERAMGEVHERQQRLQVERALREADRTYSRVVESLRDYVVLLLDADGRVRDCNSAATQILGYQPGELRGQPVQLINTLEDRAAGTMEAELREAAETGRAGDDRWLQRKDGRRFFGTGVTTALYGDDGRLTGFSKIVRDNTEARQAALALKAAVQEAERANAAKDRFLAVLSHELRTPLTPISTAVQILERSEGLPERLRPLLAMIRRNVSLEARLIDDLLDLNSIGHGKLHLEHRPVDLHVVVRSVVEMCAADVQDKGLRLSLDLAARHSGVLGDEARLQQVVWNLVRNAVKFTPAGGEVRLASRNPDGGGIVLSCSDTGIGIHADALPRIFTPFEQADPRVSKRFGGLGLGLSIAQGLAHSHGGQLQVRSDGEGLGACFELRLPVREAAERAASDERGPEPASTTQPIELLIVEDNPDSAEALALLLETLGHRVETAATVAAARLRLSQRGFDAVVSDIGLPDGSGLDVVRLLQGRCPAIALTGYGSPEDLRRSREAGFAAHLTKPIDPMTLHHALLELTGRVSRAA
ncbi:hybrid sensor histidine kinase/response regulator [Caldimonas tepidiphila]|uniref:hybrid sensor histidine kinase/response regulator n=1 Tax=Caldimonas tepidiphila TaxID=2315841 RepID=UPI000E5BB986|nr:response regulator [Caldimonas tepidiphila]